MRTLCVLLPFMMSASPWYRHLSQHMLICSPSLKISLAFTRPMADLPLAKIIKELVISCHLAADEDLPDFRIQGNRSADLGQNVLNGPSTRLSMHLGHVVKRGRHRAVSCRGQRQSPLLLIFRSRQGIDVYKRMLNELMNLILFSPLRKVC